jgi:holliday junction DNA helicase RuvB
LVPPRLISPGPSDEDAAADQRLRPQRFEDFPGQDAVKEQLLIQLQAARARGEALDHVLL